LNEIAVKRGQSLAQMAIAWVLRNGKVSSVLVGAEKVSHIEDNIAALNNLEFSAEELSQIDSILKA
jgi:L-glyceraldehyde 3-phosphate reductase